MKKVLFVLLLAAATASAQVYPPDASSGTATSVSESAFPLEAPDGSTTAPSYSFSGNTDMGMFRLGESLLFQNENWDTPYTGRSRLTLGQENFSLQAVREEDETHTGTFQCFDETTANMRCTISFIDGNGSGELQIGNEGVISTENFLLPDGTGALKALSFSGNTDMGLRRNSDTLYIESGDIFAPTTAGYIVLSSNTNYLSVRNADATDNSVGVRESGGAGEGTYMRTNGVERFSLTTTALSSTLPFLGADGTSAAPTYSFTNDPGTGIYRPADLATQFSAFALTREATANGSQGEIFRAYAYDNGAGNIGQYFHFKDPDGTTFFSLKSDASGTDATRMTLSNIGGTYTWSLNMTASSHVMNFDNAASGSTNQLWFYHSPTGAGDGTNTVSSIWFYDNYGTDYARIMGPIVGPTRGTTIYMPEEDGYFDVINNQDTATLTDASATNILRFNLTDEQQVFGTLKVMLECRNATPNWVIMHESYDFVCLNQADTEVCASGTLVGTPPEVNDGVGTFTTSTLGFSYGTNQVTFTMDADCSLTTPTLLEANWEIEFHNGGEMPSVTALN